jgi:hypothetical protein
MRAAEFTEADLGTHPRRASRSGARPRRGHEPVPRYRSADQEQLDELTFLGSECTKDCSGHRAGYEWSSRKGNRPGNSPYSPSFNKGANLRAAGK